MNKKRRLKEIKEIILANEITGQDVLLNMLLERGFEITQATLSRDIKELKIIKAPTSSGSYTYQLSDAVVNIGEEILPLSTIGFISVGFSGNLAVIKTRPGYAMAIAGEIDQKASHIVLGTVAGDDTILVIPKEKVNRHELLKSLAEFIPNIQ